MVAWEVEGGFPDLTLLPKDPWWNGTCRMGLNFLIKKLMVLNKYTRSFANGSP